MKKTYILFVTIFICVNLLFSQDSPNVNYPVNKVNLPDVASLMKFIDYPTDLHSGLMSINIPLYEIIEGDLTLPISVSYHASGLKADDTNGRIAQGWTLNAEPGISRSIEGKPDERGYLNTVIPQGPFSTPYYLESLIAKDFYDLNSDRYYYKLFDKSGKFYFQRDLYTRNSPAEIILQQYEPIKITRTPGGSFEIIDEKGVKYQFADGSGTVNDIYTQWQATEVTSASEKYRITFDYMPFKKKLHLSRNGNPYYIAIEESDDNPFSETLHCFQCGPKLRFPALTTYLRGYSNNYELSTYSIIKDPDDNGFMMGGINHYGGVLDENIRGQYPNCAFTYPSTSMSSMAYRPLKTISTSTIEVLFHFESLTQTGYDDEEPLVKIEIKDKVKNEIIRTIHFRQSPFNGSSSLRKLDEILIVGKKGTDTQKYTFEYSETERVPRRNTLSVDHWGFVYGSEGYGSGIPQQYVEAMRWYSGYGEKYRILIGDSYKDGFGGRVGIIKSMTYPTGRKSTFHFEHHQYSHYENGYKELAGTGGLRIAKIEEYDPVSGKKLIKQYKYGEQEDGVGFARRHPSLDHYQYEYDVFNGSCSWGITKVRMFLPEPIAPMTHSGGCPVKYDYVSEYVMGEKEDGSIINNGKTLYKFRYTPPVLEGYVPGTNISYDTQESDNNNLLQKIEYKYNDSGSLIPVSRTTYEYTSLKSRTLSGMKAFQHLRIRSNENQLQEWQIWSDYGSPFTLIDYSFGAGCDRILSETKELFYEDGRQKVTEEKKYTYEKNVRHAYPLKIEMKTGRNKNEIVIDEEYTYVQDIVSPSNAENELIRKNQLNTIIKKRSRDWTNTNIYGLSNGIPVPLSTWLKFDNNDKERVKILQHDTYGNPVHVLQDEVYSSVYIWGYNGTRLITEIKNATYEQVANIIGSSITRDIPSRIVPSDADWNLLRNLRANPAASNFFITTYKYTYDEGIVETTDPSGKTTYYDYDGFARLKNVYIGELNNNGQITKKKMNSYEYHYQNH